MVEDNTMKPVKIIFILGIAAAVITTIASFMADKAKKNEEIQNNTTVEDRIDSNTTTNELNMNVTVEENKSKDNKTVDLDSLMTNKIKNKA